MISRLEFARKKSIAGLEKLINYYYDAYYVESELKGIYYGVDNFKFAVITEYGIVFCPLHEVPSLAEKMKSEIKNEILQIYEMRKERRYDTTRDDNNA